MNSYIYHHCITKPPALLPSPSMMNYNITSPSSPSFDVENAQLISSLALSSSSSATSSLPSATSSSSFIPSSVPAFPYTPSIRVPPPLLLSEIPLRERRGFCEFVTIIPRPECSAPMPARGQLEPRAGALPRRRRASSVQQKPAIIHELRNFDFDTPSESSDEED